MEKKGKNIIAFDGPQGAGKDAILREIIARNPNIKKIVSNATRTMREGEVDGVDYFFITEQEFLQRVKSGDIFEHSTGTYNNYRGMSKSVVDKAIENGKIGIVNLDIVGHRALRKVYPGQVLSIFITVPKELIRKRLELIADPDIEKRLSNYDHRHTFINEADYVITNDGTIDEAVEKVLKILEKEIKK